MNGQRLFVINVIYEVRFCTWKKKHILFGSKIAKTYLFKNSEYTT